MTQTGTLPRLDERVVGAGTTVRFVMLVVLLLAASGSVLTPVLNSFHDSDLWSCELAAGADPAHHATDASMLVSTTGQDVPYQACVARYAPPPPWWLVVVCPIALSVLTALLFLALSAWKARRGRVVPLASMDPDGALGTLLTGLAAAAGLSRLPRIVVDPAAASVGALVFGRNRRPTVCLHGGLLTCRDTDPERFRAVLLHEFAHIRNGDVTLTYATVALWRVYLAAVLGPYAVWEVRALVDGPGEGPTAVPSLVRHVVLPGAVAALVYLARSDVLRSREVYADLTAVRTGAHLDGWAVPAPDTDDGPLRRAFASFAELWRTHPRWDLRRGALTDPAPLFGVRALPMFLAGVAATLINTDLAAYLVPYGVLSLWYLQLMALAPAVLVTGVVGISLWRAVTHAVLTGRPVPSGVRTGLWVGSGLAVGELLTGRGTGFGWLPVQPGFLVFLVLAGVVFSCWVTQCASLWARTWRGRSMRPVMLLSLTAVCLLLAAWLGWWQLSGVLYTDGVSYSLAGARAVLLRVWPGPAGSHSAALSVFAAVWPRLGDMFSQPFAMPGITALWVVPLLAWTVRPATGTPGWVAAAGVPGLPPADPLPPLRRVLGPGLLGGALSWVAAAVPRASVHIEQPGAQHLGNLDELIYFSWVFVALAASAALAAVLAGVVASTSPYRLLIVLVAAETAVLVGMAGILLLVWHPTAVWVVFVLMGQPAILVGALAALAVAAVGTTPPSLLRALPPGPRFGGSAARRRCLGAICVVALGVSGTLLASQTRRDTLQGGPSLGQQQTQQWAATPSAPVSAQTRAEQVHAWRRLGGLWLLQHAGSYSDQLGRTLQAADAAEHLTVSRLSRLRPLCLDFGQLALRASDYFRVPDPQAQTLWQQSVLQMLKGSRDCLHALDQQDDALFGQALGEYVEAHKAAESASTRVDAVLRAAGY
ncbi:M48 family metallopeptidase [Peterkaempfera sp. SMS 1(5)a]|uniref:M48 family metallopeptidase n=1 Tax=Peterkaempfera podocarpi TaxID=3232308 RepID=UPI00367266CD